MSVPTSEALERIFDAFFGDEPPEMQDKIRAAMHAEAALRHQMRADEDEYARQLTAELDRWGALLTEAVDGTHPSMLRTLEWATSSDDPGGGLACTWRLPSEAR